MTDYRSHEAVKVLEANRNLLFFLYLAYNAPHTPLQTKQEDYEAPAHIDHRPTREYAAMIPPLTAASAKSGKRCGTMGWKTIPWSSSQVIMAVPTTPACPRSTFLTGAGK